MYNVIAVLPFILQGLNHYNCQCLVYKSTKLDKNGNRQYKVEIFANGRLKKQYNRYNDMNLNIIRSIIDAFKSYYTSDSEVVYPNELLGDDVFILW